MRTLERTLVAIVCITATAYLAAQAYIPQPQIVDASIVQLYPPTLGIHEYAGPALKINQLLLVFRLNGGLWTQKLVVQAINMPGSVEADAPSCLVLAREGDTLLGPCLTQTVVRSGGSENIMLVVTAPLFVQPNITAGYYEVIYGQPKVLDQLCPTQASIYINSTQILQVNSTVCVTISLVQASYVKVSLGGGYG